MAVREHLFRAKNAGGEGWIYGVPLDDEIIRNVEGFVVGVKIKPETVCEFTGLTDKNGVKIFEGDIVQTKTCVKTKAWHVVLFENGAVYLKTFNKVKTTPLAENMNFQSIMREIEVIGNIFDNPELTGGEQK